MFKHIAVLLAACCAVAGCNPVANTKAAEQGVVAFHDSLNVGQFAQIYDSSGPERKSSMSRDEFVKFLSALHSKLGTFRSGQTTNWRDNATTNGHFLVIQRDAKFDRGPATEEFVFRVGNDQAVLVGWHINSNVLITG